MISIPFAECGIECVIVTGVSKLSVDYFPGLEMSPKIRCSWNVVDLGTFKMIVNVESGFNLKSSIKSSPFLNPNPNIYSGSHYADKEEYSLLGDQYQITMSDWMQLVSIQKYIIVNQINSFYFSLISLPERTFSQFVSH